MRVTIGPEEPSGDTPSASLRSAAPSEREPGRGAHHSTGCLRNRGVGGRFSSPLRNSKDFGFYHSTDDTPSVSFADSSLREGAGIGLYHSTGVLAKIRGFGRFSSPLRKGGFHLLQYTPLLGQFSFPGCRSPGGFWTASSRSPGTCRPGFPWPPSGALPGSWWGRRSRWRCRRGGGGR